MTADLAAQIEAHHVVLWRAWRSAAVAESRALRLLPTSRWGRRPIDLVAVAEDALYLTIRQHHNEQVRRRRARKRTP